jgi:hypothetical protein
MFKFKEAPRFGCGVKSGEEEELSVKLRIALLLIFPFPHCHFIILFLNSL